ncbi:Hypothetical predicted protein [Olea europaea subsp. europaea]|uniref:Uncharacterized protein n=1 Tax=Olea europaea subsp. europaea TaxID=158383 RepID=A0A8S0VNZ2_OLEEU|nr:Hypothetical predicted protein [Olea europaea subsp. europaea]
MGENEYLNKNPLFLELERGAADEEGKPEQETHSKDAAQGVAAIFKYSFSFSFLAQLLSVTVAAVRHCNDVLRFEASGCGGDNGGEVAKRLIGVSFGIGLKLGEKYL